MRGRS
ncbi:hypothetical protein LINPERPRIM_LOCUS28773 [Linum perenne]